MRSDPDSLINFLLLIIRPWLNTVLKSHTLFILLSFFVLQGHGQILDDSTKMIYGPKTTSYVQEDDFLYNRYKRKNTDSVWSNMDAPYILDTTLNDFHNYNYVYQKNNNIYQDLGRVGSPLQSIYYKQPTQIGKSLGFNVFDSYAIDPHTMRYYDTKSPYTSLHFMQGNKGVLSLEVEHTRNIRPNWNMGLSFRRMTALKVIGATDPFTGIVYQQHQISDWNFSFYTRYHTRNERYQILLNFTHLHHTNYDTGGILKNNYDSTFGYNLEKVNLYIARSIDRRENYHLYHEYSLDEQKTIQIYHSADFQKRTNRYNDQLTNTGTTTRSLDYDFYSANAFGKDTTNGSQFRFSSLFINDRTDYKLLENTIGLKGNLGNLTYRAYLRRKDFSYKQLSYDTDSIPRIDTSVKVRDVFPVSRILSENFIGGSLGYFFKDSSYIKAEAEYLFYGNPSNTVETMHDYRLNVQYFYKYLNFGYNLIKYSPTLVQQQYRGNIAEWNNLYSNHYLKQTTAQQLFAGLTANTSFLSVSPKVTYDRVLDFVYYDTLALPAQNNKTMQFLAAELQLNLKLGIFHMDLYGKYTKSSGTPVAKMVPLLFNHNRVYLQSYVFKKATMVQLGIDTYWKSTYYAYKYMPVTQQFYVNNNFPILNYMLIDVFLNVKIKTVRAFLKISHVNQASGRGYYITPYYSGMPRTFDFGINWRFYD
jgi:hypothetical protein